MASVHARSLVVHVCVGGRRRVVRREPQPRRAAVLRRAAELSRGHCRRKGEGGAAVGGAVRRGRVGVLGEQHLAEEGRAHGRQLNGRGGERQREGVVPNGQAFTRDPEVLDGRRLVHLLINVGGDRASRNA
eukprot:6174890-Pleurochrysis_carterae.AAC.1